MDNEKKMNATIGNTVITFTSRKHCYAILI